MTTQTAQPVQGSEAVAHELSGLLADTFTLYLKTHGYHWNVIGQNFRSLHLMFEEQYVELSAAIDILAEQIRALGQFAPGSLRAMARLATVEDEDAAPEASEMVCRLIEAHETVVRSARRVLAAAEAAGDPTTVDLVTERLAVHEKTLWMLRATAA